MPEVRAGIPAVEPEPRAAAARGTRRRSGSGRGCRRRPRSWARQERGPEVVGEDEGDREQADDVALALALSRSIGIRPVSLTGLSRAGPALCPAGSASARISHRSPMKEAPRILVVDDDPSIGTMLKRVAGPPRLPGRRDELGRGGARSRRHDRATTPRSSTSSCPAATAPTSPTSCAAASPASPSASSPATALAAHPRGRAAGGGLQEAGDHPGGRGVPEDGDPASPSRRLRADAPIFADRSRRG